LWIGWYNTLRPSRSIAPFVLGAIERHVGVAHDVGGVDAGAVIDHGDADAGADHDGMAVDQIRSA
jgi:hypothetical protein